MLQYFSSCPTDQRYSDICEVLNVHVGEGDVLDVHVGTRDLLDVGGRDLDISSRTYLMPMYVGTVLSYLMPM